MSEPFLGEIRMFAGNFAPREYSFCMGQIISISQNQGLYSLIGTAYGGNGITSFGLPDLRGRVPVGVSEVHVRGQRFGNETVALTKDTIPAHNHYVTSEISGSLEASTDQANLTTPSTNTRLGAGYASGYSSPMENYNKSESSPNVALSGTTIGGDVELGNTGAGVAHNNMQPFLAINYIISMNGDYPSRS